MTTNLRHSAYNQARAAGIDFREDFHTLTFSQVDLLVELSKKCGYRKPKAASGSTARYFFTYLAKNFCRK